MIIRSLLALSIVVCGLAWPSSLRAQAADKPLPLVFHVAVDAGRPVADPAYLAEQLARANAIFEPLGLKLVCAGLRRAPGVPARIVTRAQRDRLGALLLPGALNVFVTGSLMDVDEPGRERRGVHWRVRSDPRLHLVILSAKAGPYVLAHELGHFFGNPAHSETAGNLMSYAHTDAQPWLYPDQIARARASAARMIAEGELRSRADGRCFEP